MTSKASNPSKRKIIFSLLAIFAAVQIFYTIQTIKSFDPAYSYVPEILMEAANFTMRRHTSEEGVISQDKITVIPAELVTCIKSSVCGSVVLNGHRCLESPEAEFTGSYVCYDSTGCDIGHQLHVIALLSRHFGEQFRLLDPMIYTTTNNERGKFHVHEINYATFIANFSNIVIPRKSMHSLCSRLVSGKEEEGENMAISSVINQPWYLSRVLVALLDEYAISTTTCPVLPSFPDAVVVYTSQIDVDLEEGERNSTVLGYCNAIKTNFQLNDTLVITDGPAISCDEVKVTTLQSLERHHGYRSSVHKLLCNIRYFAQYRNQLAHSNAFIQKLIFAEMLRSGNKSSVYDIASSSWNEPLTSENTTCERCTGCGCMTLPGFACDPFRKFTGEFICHDSSDTGCGLGHQLNAIATLWKYHGNNFRVIDPIKSGDHSEYDDLSYSAFMKGDLLIPRDETMFKKCSRIDNGYDMGVNAAGEMGDPNYLSNVLVPFINAHFLPCPDLPMIPNAVAVKIRSTDHYPNEDELRAYIKKHCDALQEHFYNFSDAVVMTDGPQLECEGFNITHFESTVQPGTYTSSAHKLFCGLRHIALYPAQLSRTESNLQQFIYAEMVRIGNNISIFDVLTDSWVTPPSMSH